MCISVRMWVSRCAHVCVRICACVQVGGWQLDLNCVFQDPPSCDVQAKPFPDPDPSGPELQDLGIPVCACPARSRSRTRPQE